MAHLLKLKNSMEAAEGIAYEKATVIGTDYKNDTLGVLCNGEVIHDIPVFYQGDKTLNTLRNGSIKNASHAFALGDETVLRLKNGKPFCVIGFAGDIWPCMKTPTTLFSGFYGGYYTQYTGIGEKIEPVDIELFEKRYKKLSTDYGCSTDVNLYINEENVTLSEGYDSVQFHGNENSKDYRETYLYFNKQLLYRTRNTEDASHCFNGTRSNYIGTFKHTISGWGLFIYQINTFYNWIPQSSGRVISDYYLFTSTGMHTKICSATTDVTGSSSLSYGRTVESAHAREASVSGYGDILQCDIYLNKADSFDSDGTTNEVNSGAREAVLSVMMTKDYDGAKTGLVINEIDKTTGQITTGGEPLQDVTDIYIKK
jgi:hypothetical protein